MLNHRTPADPAVYRPARQVQDQTTMPATPAVAWTPDTLPVPTAPQTPTTVLTARISTPPPPSPAADLDTERHRLHRTNALLMFGLTVTCFVFLGYLITIDKADLQTGIPATLAVVLPLNVAVFGTRTWIHRTRRAAAAASYAAAGLLDPGTGADNGTPQ